MPGEEGRTTLRMQPGPCSRHQERCIEMLKVMRSVSQEREGKSVNTSDFLLFKVKKGEIKDLFGYCKGNEIIILNPHPSNFSMKVGC